MEKPLAIKKNHSMKRPRHVKRLRRTVKRLSALMHQDPAALGDAIKILGGMMGKKLITMHAIYRILDAPLAMTTMRSHLKKFSTGQMNFDQLSELVESAYAKRVPKREIGNVLNARQGDFYHRLLAVAARNGAPRSFVTNMCLRRMAELKFPGEDIKNATKLKWKIHKESHRKNKAIQEGKRATELDATRKIRELELEFFEKYAKRL